MILRYLLFILTFYIAEVAFANDIKFYHLGKKQGLSQSTVNCIIKDRQGYFWFGTNDGLNRWDGYVFKVYTYNKSNKNSIGQGRINVIYEDVDGYLWIGTYQGGLTRYQPEYDKFENYTITNKLSGLERSNNVVDIISYDNEILIGTFGGGVFKFNKQSKIFVEVKVKTENGKALDDLNISRLFFDTDSNLWIAHSKGVFKLKKYIKTKTEAVFIGEEFFIDQAFYEIFQDSRNNMWFGTIESGAFYVDSKTKVVHTFKVGQRDGKNISHPIIRRICEDKNGSIWLGTGGDGINIYSYETQTFTYCKPVPGNIYSISSNIIYSFYTDENHDLWIGTYNGGVSYTNSYKQKFNHTYSYGQPGNLDNNSILSFSEMPDGKIWIGTDGGGLNIFDPKSGIHNYFPIGSKTENQVEVIKSMEFDKKHKKLYVGTYRNGLYVYDLKTSQIINYRKGPKEFDLPSNDIWDIAIDKDGETIWLGTLGGGLCKFLTSQGKFITFKTNKADSNSLADDYVGCVYIDNQNNLWLGTFHNGLCLTTDKVKGKFMTYSKSTSKEFSSNEVRAIYKDSRNILWVGTHAGGLNYLIPGSVEFKSVDITDGLAGNTVESIQEDLEGNIWLATNNGLSKLIWDNGNISFKNYTTSDGLESGEFNTQASLRATDGKLYFGGINGYNYFLPNDIIDKQVAGPIVITGLSIFNDQIEPGEPGSALKRSIEFTDTLKLNYKQSTFTLDFAMLDFFAPEKNVYQYRLFPFEKNWVDAGNRRRAVYTNLDPGVYSFQVIGKNSQGKENSTGTNLKIIITPPYWQKVWFKALVFLVLVVFLISIYSLRVRELKLQKGTLKQKVAERTKELSDLNKLLETSNKEIITKSNELSTSNKLLEESLEEIQNKKNEIETHRNNLEHLVNERTSELEKAKMKAEESEKLKMAFLSNMSHEIRTPMNAIVGFASLLDDSELTQEQKSEYIKQVNKNSESLLILIDDILDLSKIEANQLTIVKTSVEINELINDIYTYWKQAKNYDSERFEFILVNNLKEEQVIIYTDEIRLKQIINNLLDNAFKFTNSGSITLKVEHKNNAVKFSVIDTGIGIPKENIELVFNRFIKGKETGRKLYRGAGLGLTISRKLSYLLDGCLEVESQVNKGSTFSFSIPITTDDLGSTSTKFKKSENSFHNSNNIYNSKILIAEDEDANFYYLSGILQKKGAVVDWAKDGEEAVEMALKNNYDIILMDIKMPNMSGLEASRKIKSFQKNQIIIAQTAFAHPEDKKELLLSGFNDYIAKPILSNELYTLIERYISEKNNIT